MIALGFSVCGFFVRLAIVGLLLVSPTMGALSAKEIHFNDVRVLLAKAPLVVGSVPAAKSLLSATGQPIVVTFFASWCPPCTQEFAHLNEVRQKFSADKVSIIGINVFENFGTKRYPTRQLARMKRFLNRTKPVFPLIVGDKALLKTFGNITRIPTVIVFDKTGKEVWRFVHAQGSDKRFSTTKEILAAIEIGLN